jgi:hypothetical protein
MDGLCGLVVRVPGYRSRGPDSIPGATRFSEKQWVWNGVHSASWVQLRSYFGRKGSCSGLEIREYGRRDPSRWPRSALYPRKLVLTSPTKGCRSSHGVFFLSTRCRHTMHWTHRQARTHMLFIHFRGALPKSRVISHWIKYTTIVVTLLLLLLLLLILLILSLWGTR